MRVNKRWQKVFYILANAWLQYNQPSSHKEVISICNWIIWIYCKYGRRVLTAWAEARVGFAAGTDAVTAAHFSLDHQKKYQNLCRQKTSLHRHQICCYANESLFTQAPFCLFFQNIPDTQERDGESEKEGGYATHQKAFADLTSSYIRRELVQIKLRLFIIPQAADHQKAFTFNLPHYHEYS